jgi:hypothetical protein
LGLNSLKKYVIFYNTTLCTQILSQVLTQLRILFHQDMRQPEEELVGLWLVGWLVGRLVGWLVSW